MSAQHEAVRAGVAFPYVIGVEGAGWVTEIGAGVTEVGVSGEAAIHPLTLVG